MFCFPEAQTLAILGFGRFRLSFVKFTSCLSLVRLHFRYLTGLINSNIEAIAPYFMNLVHNQAKLKVKYWNARLDYSYSLS